MFYSIGQALTEAAVKVVFKPLKSREAGET